jgi:carbon monoxide dehydrogenase subunit G
MAAQPNLRVVRLGIELEVGRTPEEVFAFLTDVDRLPEWQTSAIRVETDGPVAEGASFRETRRFLGREYRTRMKVSVYEPPRRFDLRSIEAPFPLTVSHLLEQCGGGTRLKVVSEAKAAGLKRFAVAAAAKTAEAELRSDFERLKQLLER